MPAITKQDTYTPDVAVDTQPGYYYVSVVDEGKFNLLAGPFDTHQEALDNVKKATAIAYKLDPWAAFYAFGTCKMEKKEIPRMGILNNQMGLEPWTKTVS